MGEGGGPRNAYGARNEHYNLLNNLVNLKNLKNLKYLKNLKNLTSLATAAICFSESMVYRTTSVRAPACIKGQCHKTVFV